MGAAFPRRAPDRPPRGAGPSVAVRAVATIAEFAACEEIQRRAFGYADRDLVPKNELISVARAGGLVLGAFEGVSLIGFAYGFLGRDREKRRFYHASRMTAVDPAHRGRGIALALKLAQRAAVLAQGIAEIRWTFDPLAAVNAHLNLHRLGAIATGLVRDLYGTTSSRLHAHGTDRLEVSWHLDRLRAFVPRDAETIVVPRVPEALLADAHLAAAWRDRVRGRFEDAFGRGLAAVDFARGAYWLAPAAPR